jgi:hypothetical protein
VFGAQMNVTSDDDVPVHCSPPSAGIATGSSETIPNLVARR